MTLPRQHLHELGLDTQDRVLLYIWMNPVKANLVERLRDYPGFVVGPDDWGKERVVLRPPWFGQGYPPKARFTPMPPRKWAGRLEEARAHYKRLIRRCEAFYRRRRRKQGKGVFGARRLRHQDPYTRPSPPSPGLSRRPARQARLPSNARLRP